MHLPQVEGHSDQGLVLSNANSDFNDLSDGCCLSLLRSPSIFASGKKCGLLGLARQTPKTQGALSYPQLGFLRGGYGMGLPRT